jgi:hypothetical protein
MKQFKRNKKLNSRWNLLQGCFRQAECSLNSISEKNATVIFTICFSSVIYKAVELSVVVIVFSEKKNATVIFTICFSSVIYKAVAVIKCVSIIMFSLFTACKSTVLPIQRNLSNIWSNLRRFICYSLINWLSIGC